jgi:hypothetical protein
MASRTQRFRQVERIAAGLIAEVESRHLADLERMLFDKRIFQTPAGSPPMPDGRSLEYLEIAEAMWRSNPPPPASGASTSLAEFIHEELRHAHLVERQLLERLDKGQPK